MKIKLNHLKNKVGVEFKVEVESELENIIGDHPLEAG